MSVQGMQPPDGDEPPPRAQVVRAEDGSTIRGVIQGENVVGAVLVSGDNSRVFVGAYERLGDAYVQPRSVFERVRLDRFAGREWLTARVEAFIQENDRGYFVLEAKAGLGKSAFLAHLVERWGCIHHFVETTPGADGVARALKSLASQVILAWKLPPNGADEVLPGSATRPDFLQNLLFEAAQIRDGMRPEERIVIVVDGLDEAGVPPGQNVLGLPRVLPRGVYFVVSQRPVEVPLRTEAPREVFSLVAENEENRRDMQDYLEAATRREGVSRALAGADEPAEHFVQVLLEKSGGVWVFLHYVVEEIERGDRVPLMLETLPTGVWQYYAQHWERWEEAQGAEAWERAHLPVLTTLAAAQEDLTLKQLFFLAGVADGPALRRVLEEDWQPFLAVSEEAEPQFRLYHASLREFLDGRADPADLTARERRLMARIAAATREAHVRICDRYVESWGGWEAGLPVLPTLTAPDPVQGYGLRHLAAHLEAAGREDDLHRLLRVEQCSRSEVVLRRPGWRGWLDRLLRRRRTRVRVRCRNVWYDVRDRTGDASGYLVDVERAWRLCEAGELPACAPGEVGETAAAREGGAAGLQYRYALLKASVNSLAEGLPPVLLQHLVEERVWTSAQALAYAQQIPDPLLKARALLLLAPHQPEPLRTEIVGAAYALVATRPEIYFEESLRVLADLAPMLPPSLAADAFRRDWARWDGARERVFEVLAPHLPEPLVRDALAEAESEESDYERASKVAALAPGLPEPLRAQAAERAWNALGDWDWGSEVRCALAVHLPEPARRAAVEWLLGDLGWLRYRLSFLGDRLDPLQRLAPHLPASDRRAFTARVSELATQTIEAGPKTNAPHAIRAYAVMLLRLASHLDPPGKRSAAREALRLAAGITEKTERRWAFGQLFPQLPALGLAAYAVARARTLADDDERCDALAALAPRLPADAIGPALVAIGGADKWRSAATRSALLLRRGELGAAEEALAAAATVAQEKLRVELLSGLLPYLSGTMKRQAMSEAVRTAMVITSDAGDWLDALGSLLQQLARAGRSDQALELVDEIAAEEDRLFGPWLVGTLIRHLLPGLPDAGRDAVALRALAAMHAWRGSGRAEGLVQILPFVPDADRARVGAEALRAIAEVEYPEVRLGLLADLLPHLSDAPRERAVKYALQLPLRYWSTDGVQALTKVAPHVPGPLLPQLLERVRSIEVDWLRSRALRAIEPMLPAETRLRLFRAAVDAGPDEARERAGNEDLILLGPSVAALGYLEEALTAARAVRDPEARARAVAALARWVPEEAEASLGLLTGLAKAQAMAALAPHLPEHRRADVLAEAAALTRAAPIHEERFLILEMLLSTAPPPMKDAVLREAVGCARELLLLGYEGVYLESLLPDLLRTADMGGLVWRETLHALALHPRTKSLRAITLLSPLLRALGGAQSVLEAIDAVRSVRRWWEEES